MVRCRRHDLAHGGVANATCGVVDDALEGLLVVRVYGQSEVRNHILHLLALVERESTIDAVGNAILAQRLLEDTRLSVGAVEDGTVVIREPLRALQLAYAACHELSLLDVRVGLDKL